MPDKIHALFNHTDLRRFLLISRYPMFIALVFLLALYIDPKWIHAGLVISILGLFIQIWSFGSLIKNQELTARGPYVLVRNPMYLGRYLMITGLVVMLGNLYVVAAFSVLYYFYMVNRVSREEWRLMQILGEPYWQYSLEVNRFLPNFKKLFNRKVWFFDWRACHRNHGHLNLTMTVVIYGILEFKAYDVTYNLYSILNQFMNNYS